MSDRFFPLKPFPSKNPLPDIKVNTTISRQNTTLKLCYLLQGNLQQIILPTTNNEVKRKDNLWQTSCFEFFLAIFHSRQYWEFNLAPTGDWNVYYFANYRRGMKPAKTFESLPFTIKTNNSTYQLEIEINLRSIIAGNTFLELAVATVIEDTNHNLSYWAITHPGTQADFHRRDSFITI